MKKSLYIAACFSVFLSLNGCADINKQDIGAVTGGVIGGVLGNQVGHGDARVAATIGGTLIGSRIGGAIGQTMDKVDRMQVNTTLESTPTNQSKAWTNPDTDTSYRVTPTKTYYHELSDGERQPCREFTTVAIIDGKKQEMYGTACRQADGSWKMVQ